MTEVYDEQFANYYKINLSISEIKIKILKLIIKLLKIIILYIEEAKELWISYVKFLSTDIRVTCKDTYRKCSLSYLLHT